MNAAKIGLPESEAIRFHAYYESNGWKVGRNPMRKWQSAMVTWRAKWQEDYRTAPNGKFDHRAERRSHEYPEDALIEAKPLL